MPEKMVKVINVQVLTLATREGIPDDRTKPLLRFELEDGRDFFMVNIPLEVAGNIAAYIADQPSPDDRLQIHELVSQLSVIENVEIDLFVPGQKVFQATVSVIPEGFERSMTFQMIPSHATLLAVVNEAPIYVADELIKQSEEIHNTET